MDLAGIRVLEQVRRRRVCLELGWEHFADVDAIFANVTHAGRECITGSQQETEPSRANLPHCYDKIPKKGLFLSHILRTQSVMVPTNGAAAGAGSSCLH